MKLYKIVFNFLLCGFLTMVVASQAWAADLKEIQARGEIRHLGIRYANFVTGDGDGFDVELVKGFAKHIGVKYQLSICGTLRPANRGVMRPAEVAVLAVSDGSVLRRFQASCNVASGDRKGVQGTVE
jgi:hypothetical protein